MKCGFIVKHRGSWPTAWLCEALGVSPGDVVVQRGTNHAWSNRTNETARVAFVLVDGVFADGLDNRSAG